ncbi:MAG: hypothetical protein CM15mP87_02930 [Candidatus Neomarinimicrobiota bacterium]|nr:MAG: hypothetical protein CM15mP87_02930 [Candidatus Neomarinimicrobiota bacterium]
MVPDTGELSIRNPELPVIVNNLKRCPVSNKPGFEFPPLDEVVVVKVPVGF